MKTQQPRPLYLDCNRSQALTAWCGAVANGLLIIWLAIWLVVHSASVDPNLIELLSTVFIALFVSDFLSGFVHWAADTWFDEKNWVRVISMRANITYFHITSLAIRFGIMSPSAHGQLC